MEHDPMGMMGSAGDIVMVHGRYTAWAPVVLVAVNAFRFENCQIAEYRNVIKAEQPTVSNRPMFTLPSA
jgi:hypothetical protein